MIRNELEREKMRTRASKRVWNFGRRLEERLEERKGGAIE